MREKAFWKLESAAFAAISIARMAGSHGRNQKLQTNGLRFLEPTPAFM